MKTIFNSLYYSQAPGDYPQEVADLSERVKMMKVQVHCIRFRAVVLVEKPAARAAFIL